MNVRTIRNKTKTIPEVDVIKFTMKTTALVTTSLVIALGIYDLICVTTGVGVDISVSRFLINSGIQAPGIVFVFGYVCGHLFGYMKPIGCEVCGNKGK